MKYLFVSFILLLHTLAFSQIEAQKAWLTYRDNETKLVATLSKDEYSGGGTVQQLTDMSLYLELIKRRAVAIFDHLQRISGEY